MDLMIGTVTAKGTKENVLNLFAELANYYDKEIIKEKGTDKKYQIEFEFSSRLVSFLEYDYFAPYSEEYNCHIIAKMFADDQDMEDDTMVLEYDNGEIIKGLADYT